MGKHIHPKQMRAQLEADLARVESDTVFTPGTRVTTDRGLPGTVKWAGRIQGAKGEWVGIELDSKKGKNSGEAKGVKYFSCRAGHGIFVRPGSLVMGGASNSSQAFFGGLLPSQDLPIGTRVVVLEDMEADRDDTWKKIL